MAAGAAASALPFSAADEVPGVGEALGAVAPEAPGFTLNGDFAAGLLSVLTELGVSGVGCDWDPFACPA